MNERELTRPLYPLDQAFVLHIQRETAEECGHLRGRIEHVSSGRESEFGSAQALLQFIESMVRRS